MNQYAYQGLYINDKIYGPSMVVIEAFLVEHFHWFSRGDVSVYEPICLSMNAGLFGVGKSTISLLSIETTLGIDGLLLADS